MYVRVVYQPKQVIVVSVLTFICSVVYLSPAIARVASRQL